MSDAREMLQEEIEDLKLALLASRLRAADCSLMIDNIRIRLCDDPTLIALDRDGEGGEFSLREFADMLHQFISDRL